MATAVQPIRKTPTAGGPRARRGMQNPRAKIAVPGNRGIKLVRAVTIRKPAAELYAFWRHLPNLAKVIKHPVAITASSPEDSHWIVSGPANTSVEWDAVIVNDERNKLIAWRSRE